VEPVRLRFALCVSVKVPISDARYANVLPFPQQTHTAPSNNRGIFAYSFSGDLELIISQLPSINVTHAAPSLLRLSQLERHRPARARGESKIRRDRPLELVSAGGYGVEALQQANSDVRRLCQREFYERSQYVWSLWYTATGSSVDETTYAGQCIFLVRLMRMS